MRMTSLPTLVLGALALGFSPSSLLAGPAEPVPLADSGLDQVRGGEFAFSSLFGASVNVGVRFLELSAQPAQVQPEPGATAEGEASAPVPSQPGIGAEEVGANTAATFIGERSSTMLLNQTFQSQYTRSASERVMVLSPVGAPVMAAGVLP